MRRLARIVPAFWVSLAVTWLLVLRGRPSAASSPEAAAALQHYPTAQCPGAPHQTRHAPIVQPTSSRNADE